MKTHSNGQYQAAPSTMFSWLETPFFPEDSPFSPIHPQQRHVVV